MKTGVDTGLQLGIRSAREAHETLTLAGVDLHEILDFPGAPTMFFLHDPDGNTLVILEDA